MKKKLAIIGASYLQVPLIKKAQSMGIETHVFAWAAGDDGEECADYFYPISIVEKERILQECKRIAIDGICSIASDLASITVNYVASKLGLTGNSLESSHISTNKHAMRECFRENGDPSPKSFMVKSAADVADKIIRYPIIVKPVDRSGSRGITKLLNAEHLENAIEVAKAQGFEKCALVEEYIGGQEYSVECISWQGKHHFLGMTRKYTTGEPHFIETAHLMPAPVDGVILDRVKGITFHALDSLKIVNGASHTELKITDDGKIILIEIGGRMGGDCIGSSLVELSTGIDFVKAVIQISLGEVPQLEKEHCGSPAAVRFVFSEEDVRVLREIQDRHPDYIVERDVKPLTDRMITDSSSRFGYYIIKTPTIAETERYLPQS